MTFAISAWDGSDEQLRRIAELYAAVFTEPPYDEDPVESIASFEARAKRYAEEDARMRLLVATEDDRTVGLVLGSGIAAGDWWWDRLDATLPSTARNAWLDSACFSVAELAVAASHRHRGVAAELMGAVLKDLPYATALLGCYQDALPAKRLYRALGWSVVDPAVPITAARAIQVMGLRLGGAGD